MTDAAWVRRYAQEVRAAVLRAHRRDSCIESTRVGIEVARYHGHHVRPAAVFAGFYTADAWASKGTRGYSVGVAATGRIARGGWDGHLLGLLDQPGLLIDFSADQFDRPDHGLRVPEPVIARVDADQLAEGIALEDEVTGQVAVYRTVTDTGWRAAPAWTRNTPAIREAIGSAIRALRQPVPHPEVAPT